MKETAANDPWPLNKLCSFLSPLSVVFQPQQPQPATQQMPFHATLQNDADLNALRADIQQGILANAPNLQA